MLPDGRWQCPVFFTAGPTSDSQTQHLLSELANTILHTSDAKKIDTKVFLTSSLQTRPDVKVSNHENRSGAWCPA